MSKMTSRLCWHHRRYLETELEEKSKEYAQNCSLLRKNACVVHACRMRSALRTVALARDALLTNTLNTVFERSK